ncbi:fimbrillin family protein [Parabacteroides goldsteinii]|uniref:fimbrillin family protein n=1 Tax=Parabacteroides goldsteinii TaxID=328812 RepID=UPI003AB5F41E
MYSAASTPPFWEPAQGEEPLLLYTEKGTVYGYVPAEKSVSLTGTPKAPLMSGIKVLDKQKFYFSDGNNIMDAATDVQWETDQEDYLYCTAAAEVDRWHPEVSLEMQHALSKVSFRVLEEGSAFAGCCVEKVVLKSNGELKKCTSAKLNLATGEMEGTLTAVDQLVFTAGGDTRAVGGESGETMMNVPVQAFGLVIPVSGVNVTLELTFDDGRTFTMKPSVAGEGPGSFTADWKKGYNYTYNLRMQPQGIELAEVKVAAWNDGGAYDVPME